MPNMEDKEICCTESITTPPYYKTIQCDCDGKYKEEVY